MKDTQTRKEELLFRFMSNEITAEDLIDTVVKLEKRAEIAISYTSEEYSSQSIAQLRTIREILQGE